MSLVFVFVNVFHRANVQLHFISLRLSLTRLSHITLLARAQPSPSNECWKQVRERLVSRENHYTITH